MSASALAVGLESDAVDEGALEGEESAEVSVVSVAVSVASASPAEVVDEWSSGVAQAIPGDVATAAPMPSATAKPPTRPMYLP